MKSPKKRTVKITLSYDGTYFKGWQSQKKGERTVQSTLANVVEKISKQKIKVHGASRTDAGVHALGQVAHFDCTTHLTEDSFFTALNYHLPKDVVVTKVSFVSDKFHARYKSKSKWYRYEIQSGSLRPVMDRTRVYWVPVELDVKTIKKVAKHFLGTHDFKAFTLPSRVKSNNVRTILDCKVKEKGGRLTIDVRGTGFLYHMVRLMVGTLVEIGRGKKKVDSIKKALSMKKHTFVGSAAKAHGLTLIKVYYR